MLKQVIKIQEKTMTEDHLDRLTSQHDLGKVYFSNRQIPKAILIFKQVVEIGKKLAKDRLDRVALQYKLARTYSKNV